MNYEPKTIAEQIECLARLTGAPQSFICQVKELFTRKGITLDSSATPYLKALEEAFQREESIRASSRQARQSVARIHDNMERLGKTYVRQVEHLKKVRSSLQEQAGRLREQHQARRSRPPVEIEGDHRSFITPTQREDLPMVPGPKEEQ